MIKLVLFALLVSASVKAQPGSEGAHQTPRAKDSTIIFTPSHPLIDESATASSSLANSWGFSGFFNDFGWGVGLYYRRALSSDFSVATTLDLGSAKGPKEFGFYTEVKLNRIFVFPLLASLQYRILGDVLGAGFRPYITAGAGPVFIVTTDGQRDFFAALGSPITRTTGGAMIGVGSYFGSDPKSMFGASLKYYIIPYKSPGIESTAGTFLNDFSAFSLNISYGFCF
ncbi:MAG: hypothetical protein JSS75_04720 [Bacteroidetes bacterium]|nr:hypothetical protein [Bacteroidota bacterium]